MSDFYAAAEGPKRRPGLARERRNQAIIAERTRWPEGALQKCWDLENRFPGWHVSYLHENLIKGFERPAGWWAVLDSGRHQADIFRTDLAELAEVMASVPPEHDYSISGCSWCLGHGTHRVKL